MPSQILVVDDDEAIRFTLRALLEDNGYEVYVAANGEAASRLLNSVSFDVIIADIWMPVLTGLELISIAHQIDPTLPIILLTGNPSLDTSIEALNQGACAYLLKPFTADQVLAAVARCIRKLDESRQQQFEQERLLRKYHELENYMLYLQGNQPGMNPETISIISDLIRGLRHELGNLATVLNLDVSLLEQTSTDVPLDQNRIDELKNNVDDLGRLLLRLKEYPQPNAHLEPIDLCQVIFTSVEDRRKQARAFHMTLTYQLPEAEVWINGDENGLRRVLANLIDNALEANRNKQGRVVNVSLKVVEHQAILTVQDEGPGFAAQLLDRPFSPAYTTKITDGFMRGLGMGLFVSNAIISLHHGNIALENGSKGGALVTITLPLMDVQLAD